MPMSFSRKIQRKQRIGITHIRNCEELGSSMCAILGNPPMIPLHPFSCLYSALKISANKIAIKLATNINIEDKEVGIKEKKMLYFLLHRKCK